MGLQAAKRKEYFNFPNYLTLGRVLLVPVVIILLAKIHPDKPMVYNKNMGLIAAAVYILAALSDLVDGYYARKFKINSIFGKYFDPLADKLMVLGAMIMLIPLDRIPAWMVVIFLSREIVVTALRGIATGEGLEIPADQWGKKKTLAQNIALVALMIHYPLWGLSAQKIGWFILWLALIMTVLSGANYIWGFSRAFKKQYQG